MRKITEKASHAFQTGYNWGLSNTQVKVNGNKVCLYLHGNMIAQRVLEGKTYFSLCGWNTPTTRERLKAIGININTKKSIAYLNGTIKLDNKAAYTTEGVQVPNGYQVP